VVLASILDPKSGASYNIKLISSYLFRLGNLCLYWPQNPVSSFSFDINFLTYLSFFNPAKCLWSSHFCHFCCSSVSITTCPCLITVFYHCYNQYLYKFNSVFLNIILLKSINYFTHAYKYLSFILKTSVVIWAYHSIVRIYQYLICWFIMKQFFILLIITLFVAVKNQSSN